ncbi:MAG: DUF4350 domain-containing protein [Polyangiales bacterium]
MKRLLLVAGLLFASPASAATLHPEHAERDVKKLMQSGDYAFCTDPPRQLPPRSIELCPLARETEGCEALAKACDDLEMRPPKPPPDWLVKVMRALGPLAQILVWLVLFAVIAAIVIPLVRAYLKRRRDAQISDPELDKKPEVETKGPLDDVLALSDAELILRRAEEAQKRGDLTHALDGYLAASLVALDHRGAIRIGRHVTNGEYVRQCSETAAKPGLREIVREFDGVKFGGRAPTQEAVARVASRAAVLVRGAAVAMLLFLVACGGVSFKPKGDPAGDDLLMEVLTKQGLTVGRPTTRLASLPMPKEGERAPAMVVDFTRTPLDEDTIAHLLRWVKKGGVLVMVGAPHDWPKPLAGEHRMTLSRDVLVGDDYKAKVSIPAAFAWDGGFKLAQTGDGETFASTRDYGEGRVIGVAGPDLFTNVGMAHAGNAAVVISLFSAVDRDEVRIARPEDGTAAPSNPFAALARAGLGPAMIHALIAVGLLFLAVGVRLARATPTLPPRRRAFVEHVEATGAFWARAKVAPHALASYVRWADEHLRTKMPRGTSDVAAFLAMRSGTSPEEASRLWSRALEARTDETPKGDELVTLKALSELVTKADG